MSSEKRVEVVPGALRQIDYGSWLFRVIAWDSLMPVCVVLTPIVVRSLFPNNRDINEFISISLPVIAFLVRIYAGQRHIRSNHCSEIVSAVQFAVFCLGILVLLAIDTLLILSQELPKGALFATWEDGVVFAVLFSIYLTAMVIAMYPGHSSTDSRPVPHDPGSGRQAGGGEPVG